MSSCYRSEVMCWRVYGPAFLSPPPVLLDVTTLRAGGPALAGGSSHSWDPATRPTCSRPRPDPRLYLSSPWQRSPRGDPRRCLGASARHHPHGQRAPGLPPAHRTHRRPPGACAPTSLGAGAATRGVGYRLSDFCDSGLLSQNNPFGLHCVVGVVDCALRQGYNGSVIWSGKEVRQQQWSWAK